MVVLRYIFKYLLVSGLGLGLTLPALALTLGRLQGAAWIGQALDLRVPVQLDQESVEGGLCPLADIFDGDSRQDPSQIKITLEPPGQGDSVKVHIVSSAAVDEPVVTIYLRVGCGQKVSRRFVLLAELKSTNVSVPLAAAPPATLEPVAPPSTPSANTSAPENEPLRGASAAPTGTTQGAAKSIARSQTVAVAGPPAKPQITSGTNGTPSKAASGRPHLRLDISDSPAKPNNPAAIATRPAPLASTPAAVASQSPNSVGTPQDAQVAALQRDLQRLLEQANTNQAALLAMQKRLEEDQGSPMPLTVLYALLALIVASLTALALAWMRHNALVTQRMQREDQQ